MKVPKSPGAEIRKGPVSIKNHCELGSWAECSNEFILKELKNVLKDILAELYGIVSFCAEEQMIVCAVYFSEKKV